MSDFNSNSYQFIILLPKFLNGSFTFHIIPFKISTTYDPTLKALNYICKDLIGIFVLNFQFVCILHSYQINMPFNLNKTANSFLLSIVYSMFSKFRLAFKAKNNQHHFYYFRKPTKRVLFVYEFSLAFTFYPILSLSVCSS